MAKQVSTPERWDIEADLVAIGSSSGGLVAAITGHDLGLSTVLLEKADTLGGGTALSAGIIWIPYNHQMLEIGLSDSREEALTYLRRISMGRHDEELLSAYLDNGPEMVRYIEEHTPLKMLVVGSPDYYAELPGGKSNGRKLIPDPQLMAEVLTEAEKTHPLLSKVRPDPVPFFVGARGTWAGGRNLIGPLVLACLNRGINILTNTRARQLIVQDGRVVGLRVERNGQDFLVKGKRGVLLAAGGYEWHGEMCKRFTNAPVLRGGTPPANEGDGHIMGMEVGAAVALMDHCIFTPVIHVPGEEADGKPVYRPIVPGYPGDILVNRYGKRCCDESFYPDIGRAFLAYDKANAESANVPIFWIADQSLLDRLPVGTLPPATLMADLLHRADTLPGLAEQLGLPSDNLKETVERFNTFAREGRDPDFHRGESAYDRWWGFRANPDHKPNPTLAPLEKPPFYGLQFHLGTVGNLGGLVTNANAQVVNVQGEVIPGLYGTSNTTAILSHGCGYDSGSCQGKSMIFGYIAARHMAQSGREQI